MTYRTARSGFVRAGEIWEIGDETPDFILDFILLIGCTAAPPVQPYCLLVFANAIPLPFGQSLGSRIYERI